MKKIITPLFLMLAVAACDSGPSTDREEATGEGAIRAIHAIPDLGAVSFLIEETTLATIDFKDVSGTSDFDNLTYEFHFETFLPGDTEATRLATREVSVDDETEYTFVFSGSLDNPEIILWEQFRRDWVEAQEQADENGTTITILDASFAHLAASLGALDLYLDTPGTAPATGNAIASLAFGDLQDAIEIEAGEYQLVVTDSNDTSQFLFASDPFVLSSATTISIVVMDGDRSSTTPFSVRVIGDGVGSELTDLNAVATMRAVHAAFNTEQLDVIIGDDFANPLAANIDFGGWSPEAEATSGEQSLNITPAGNPGSFLAEETVQLIKGRRHTLFLTGLPGELDGLLLFDSARRLSTHANLRVVQGSIRTPSLDLYVIPIGSDIALLSPTISSLPYTGSSGYLEVAPDTYDLVFTLPGTKTVVAGPASVDLAKFGIYDVVTTDSLQVDVAQIIFEPDEP